MDEVTAARAALDRFAAAYRQPAPPVDVDELAESLCCLRVRRADDLSLVPGAPSGLALSGMLLPGRHEIWVSRHETWERRRFSVAHEIGHFLLHAAGGDEAAVYCRAGDLRPDPESPSGCASAEANRFAAELLMPEALVDAGGRADRARPDRAGADVRGVGHRDGLPAGQPRPSRGAAGRSRRAVEGLAVRSAGGSRTSSAHTPRRPDDHHARSSLPARRAAAAGRRHAVRRCFRCAIPSATTCRWTRRWRRGWRSARWTRPATWASSRCETRSRAACCSTTARSWSAPSRTAS